MISHQSDPLPLSQVQIDAFRRDGFLVVPSFYDVEREIQPIQQGIHAIIGILIGKYGIGMPHVPFHPGSFDSGYMELIGHDRRIGGEVYDAVKQIPAFVRLASSMKHDRLMKQLRDTDMPGIPSGGSGIRIDNPGEEKYRSGWHQDYPGQFRSLDGLVFWSPLVRVDPSLGPVRFCVGSHKDGPVRVHMKNTEQSDKSGVYALVLENEQKRVASYPQVAPLTSPGDLVLIDFLTLHCSGHNQAERARWTLQMRYFNFRDPTGIRIGWCGSFAAGKSIREVHPELVVESA